MNFLPQFNVQLEVNYIASFLKAIFARQNFKKAVIGVSGGVDSAVALLLLAQALKPENVFPIYLPFFKGGFTFKKILAERSGISEENFQTFSIKATVQEATDILGIDKDSADMQMKIRFGNLVVRTRMIFLYDAAKKYQALVCGTENKSENLLGYYTRYGDEASDIEPIRHLYKTQVYDLARYLGVPDGIIKSAPSAELWSGQTDEEQFGFSYAEADQVLYLYFEKKYLLEKIVSLGFPGARKVLDHVAANSFKHKVPYKI